MMNFKSFMKLIIVVLIIALINNIALCQENISNSEPSIYPDSNFSTAFDESLQYKFKRIGIEATIHFGSGFLAKNLSKNEGFLTGTISGGAELHYYFKKLDKNGKEIEGYSSPVSLFVLGSWGPFLINPNVVTNYYYLTSGISVDQFSSVVSYGGVFAINSSGIGSRYLYGVSGSLDNIQTPFFFSWLFGDEFTYVIIAGFKIPISVVIRPIIRPFNKS